MNFFSTFFQILFQVLTAAIFLRAILSWFMISPGNPLIVFLYQITEPILAPLRRLIPPIGGTLDISPMVAIILLMIASSFI